MTNITLYIFAGLALINAGQFALWRYTVSQRDKERAKVTALKALGNYQESNTKEVTNYNDKLKKELDEKFKDQIASLDVPSTGELPASSSGNMSRSLDQLSRSELQRRLRIAEAKLKIIEEWRNRVRAK